MERKWADEETEGWGDKKKGKDRERRDGEIKRWEETKKQGRIHGIRRS